MSDVNSEVQPDVIVIGAEQEKTKDNKWFLGNEALSELNVCFMATTAAGLVCGMLGSTLGACISMLVFLGYGFGFHKRIPNMERFADSLYYQGFILTLFALLWALTGKGAGNLTSDGIILQFGLALWTTFIGMGGRIVVIQFFTTAFDQEDDTREAINAYVEQLNKEIGATLEDLRRFREEVIRSAEKTTSDLVEEAKGNRKETADAIKAAMNTLIRSMGQATTKLDQSVGGVADKIAQLQIPTDVFSSQIKRVTDVMTADLERIRTDLEGNSTDFAVMLKQNVAVLKQTQGDLGTLRQSLADINQAISDASTTTANSIAISQKNLQAAQQAEIGVEKLGRTAEGLANQLDLVSINLNKRAQGFVEELEKSNQRITDSFLDGARKVTNAVGEVRRLNESSP